MVWAASTVIALGAAGAAGAGAIAAANASGRAADAQSQASQDASATQLSSSQQALQFQREQAAQAQANQQPWRDAGISALNRISAGLGQAPASEFSPKWDFQFGQSRTADTGFLNKPSTAFSTPFDFQTAPGYDFRKQQGQDAIDNSAAAHGGLLSGAQIKAASQYNQNFASNEYGNAYNRYMQDNTAQFNRDTTSQTNQFNRLASVAGLGQTAANQMSTAGITSGQNMANNVLGTGAQIGQNQIGAGNAQASGYIGQSNAFNGALGQGVNAFSQYNAMQGQQNMYAQNNAMSYANPYTQQASDINALNGGGNIVGL